MPDCPNCHAPLKNGLMASNSLLEPYQTNVINVIEGTSEPGHCTKCGDVRYFNAKTKLGGQIDETTKAIWSALAQIPVISAQNPLNWDYEVLSMVTGQTTTGTGVFAEFFSSWTDLVGAQSDTYNTKLKAGEDLCFAQLRRKTLNMGGNAVIATDIDYSEVGGDKGMLMVCMAGTAVNVKNIEVLGEERSRRLNEIGELQKRLVTLKALYRP